MSIRKRVAFGGLASWLHRFAGIGLSLILLPVLFRGLGQEELGIWFLLAQTTGFVGLMDLGLGPTLTRRIALARGASGSAGHVELSPASLRQIGDLIATGRRLYRLLAIGAFLLLWPIGVYFLGQLQLTELGWPTVVLAWTVIAVSHAATVWSLLWPSVLQGLGLVGWDSIVATLVTSVTILVEILLVMLGGGLVALAVTAGTGAILLRLGTLLVLRRRQPAVIWADGAWDRSLAGSMAGPAIKAWLTALGAFLVLKTDQYFIAVFEGAERIPAYHVALQLLTNIYLAAVAFSAAAHPFVSQLWSAGQLDEIHRLVERSGRLSLTIVLSGIGVILVAAPAVFELWLGPGNFVGYPVLVVFAVTVLLETNHVTIAYASRATEDEAFALWALGAGAINLVLTWALVQAIGLLGVALGTLVAQASTNNWYAVYRGLKRLRLPFRRYASRVLAPVGVVAAVHLVVLGGAGLLSAHAGPLPRVIVTFLAAVVALAASIWLAVLERPERQALLRRSGSGRRSAPR